MQPTTILILTGLISDRERKGVRWCEKWGVGKRRKLVHVMLPHAPFMDGTTAGYVSSAREAATLLAAECRRCKGCNMSEVP